MQLHIQSFYVAVKVTAIREHTFLITTRVIEAKVTIIQINNERYQ